MLDRGKLAVLSIMLLAAAMAGAGWWWNFQRGRRCLELYGSEAALLIRTAPLVQLVGDTTAETIDLSQAQGLVHARTALLADTSYLWDNVPAEADDVHTVRFTHGNTHVSLQFSATGNSVFVLETGRSAMLDQKTAEGWRQFIERNLSTEKPTGGEDRN